MKKNRKITVVSLGFASADSLTFKSFNTLKEAQTLILRTDNHPLVSFLTENGISFTTMDAYYERYEDFDEMHAEMAKELWKKASEGDLVFAVIDASNDAVVQQCMLNKPEHGTLEIIPAVSALDHFKALYPAMDLVNGIRIYPATSLLTGQYDPNVPLLVTELDSELLACDLKLWILDHYHEENKIVFMSSSLHGASKAKEILPEDLDRQKYYDHTVAVYLPVIPLLEREHYSLDDLNLIMDKLRSPDGCPWDNKQTHLSLKPYLLEETWETISAIDEADDAHLAEEMGDLLFQIVFHASIGKTFEEYTMQEVLDRICRKLIFRHIHVFGNEHCENADEVSAIWEKQKNLERGTSTIGEVLECVSEGFPSLTYASKALKHLAKLTHWNDESEPWLEKALKDEPAEIRQMIAVVRSCREKGLDPELILHQGIRSLIRSVSELEKSSLEKGISTDELPNIHLI